MCTIYTVPGIVQYIHPCVFVCYDPRLITAMVRWVCPSFVETIQFKSSIER